jgi:hypothetical protein
MNLVIPPLFFYLMGAALTIGGAVRAATLGRRRDASREITADTPERARERRRHRIWGLLYVATGLFLIASTAGVLRLRH